MDMDDFDDTVNMFTGTGGVAFYKSGNLVFRNRLNLESRISVLRQYERTPNVNQLAQIFKCGRRQIKTILRKRKKYLASWRRRTKRDSDFETPDQVAVGLILNEWVCRSRAYRIEITDDVLRNNAKDIAHFIRFTEFKPSNVWLQRFKQKYNISGEEPNIKQELDSNMIEQKSLAITALIEELSRSYEQSVLFPNGEPASGVKRVWHHMDYVMPNGHQEDISMQNDSIVAERSNETGLQAVNHVGQSGNDDIFTFAKEIATYKEALNQLGPLEQFALLKENIRAVGLINQLENLFREEMEKIELRF